MTSNYQTPRASNAYVAATYVALGLGTFGFLLGLWNAEMQLNEKGYYLTLLAFGLFSAVSLQKSVRDRHENIPVSSTYFGLCYAAVGLSILLLASGLWNATLLLSEKGFYAMSFVLALYSAVTVQKNVRDNLSADNHNSTRFEQPVFPAE
jgi:uncharacterized membrane protein YiaA